VKCSFLDIAPHLHLTLKFWLLQNSPMITFTNYMKKIALQEKFSHLQEKFHI